MRLKLKCQVFQVIAILKDKVKWWLGVTGQNEIALQEENERKERHEMGKSS